MSKHRKWSRLKALMKHLPRDILPYCNGKKRFPDKKSAVSAVNFLMRHGHGRRHRPDYVRVYPCPDCQGYHMTSRHIERVKLGNGWPHVG